VFDNMTRLEMAAEATIDIAINAEPWRSPQPANDWRAPARTVKISRATRQDCAGRMMNNPVRGPQTRYVIPRTHIMRNDIEFKDRRQSNAARLALLAGWTAGKIANYRDG